MGVVLKCDMLENAYSKKNQQFLDLRKVSHDYLKRWKVTECAICCRHSSTSLSLSVFSRAWQLYTQAHCSLVHMKSLFSPQHVTAALKVVLCTYSQILWIPQAVLDMNCGLLGDPSSIEKMWEWRLTQYIC